MPNRNTSAFTLVELLLSVSIIAILAGITLSVINVSAQRNRAEDSVRFSNLEKIVLSINAFETVEGRFPTDPNGDGSPMDDPLMPTYITVWPDGEPTATTSYEYGTNPAGTMMGLAVATTRGTAFRYHSTWGEIKECNNDVLPISSTCNGEVN